MEIQIKNSSKTLIRNGPQIDFGRGHGFDSSDRTVSRRHVSFRIDPNDQARVHLEVIGKNPIWVHDSKSNEIRVYRSSEKGVLQPGDSFCVSAKKPVWFNLKRIETEGEATSGIEFGDELAERLQKSAELVEIEHIDFSNIDPVKEFGFVVLGHEFDRYPKKMIRETKNWDWFLEDHREQSDDDDDDDNGESERKRKRKKKKKGAGNDGDDEDWTGESEEDAAELINKSRKVQKPKYSTRSKDPGKNSKSATSPRQGTPRSKTRVGDEEEDEDEDEEDDDETLGGFIVGDEDLEEEDEGDFEEDEEEFEDNDNEAEE